MHAPFQEMAAPAGKVGAPVKAVSAEYETEIHFQKCYGVMAELFEIHKNMEGVIPDAGFKFLDLGCAPGGFSCFLLEDHRCMTGFGVTLPSTSGGFPMRLRHPNFLLQQGDLFEIGVNDVIAKDVQICICDAQYLRNNVSWDGQYSGVRCRSKQHGVWALLIKQFWLGLSRLTTGGILIFRFGWRDPGPHDPATIWYKKMTIRLFTLLHDLFEQVREVKSDYFNALQSSFYVCCSNFSAERFEARQVAKLLGVNYNYLISTEIQDSNELDILPQVDQIRSEEVDTTISEMLDRIDRLRLVHEGSRKVHQQREKEREDPSAVVVMSPVLPWMTDEALTSSFSIYGRVRRVERDGEKEVAVFLACAAHARAAVTSMRSKGGLGEGVEIWLKEEQVDDGWGAGWGEQPSEGQEESPSEQPSKQEEPAEDQQAKAPSQKARQNSSRKGFAGGQAPAGGAGRHNNNGNGWHGYNYNYDGDSWWEGWNSHSGSYQGYDTYNYRSDGYSGGYNGHGRGGAGAHWEPKSTKGRGRGGKGRGA